MAGFWSGVAAGWKDSADRRLKREIFLGEMDFKRDELTSSEQRFYAEQERLTNKDAAEANYRDETLRIQQAQLDLEEDLANRKYEELTAAEEAAFNAKEAALKQDDDHFKLSFGLDERRVNLQESGNENTKAYQEGMLGVAMRNADLREQEINQDFDARLIEQKANRIEKYLDFVSELHSRKEQRDKIKLETEYLLDRGIHPSIAKAYVTDPAKLSSMVDLLRTEYKDKDAEWLNQRFILSDDSEIKGEELEDLYLKAVGATTEAFEFNAIDYIEGMGSLPRFTDPVPQMGAVVEQEEEFQKGDKRTKLINESIGSELRSYVDALDPDKYAGLNIVKQAFSNLTSDSDAPDILRRYTTLSASAQIAYEQYLATNKLTQDIIDELNNDLGFMSQVVIAEAADDWDVAGVNVYIAVPQLRGIPRVVFKNKEDYNNYVRAAGDPYKVIPYGDALFLDDMNKR